MGRFLLEKEAAVRWEDQGHGIRRVCFVPALSLMMLIALTEPWSRFGCCVFPCQMEGMDDP